MHNKQLVVQLARIPCAGSGFELSTLINIYSSKYECRYILGTEYADNNPSIPFRAFPTDLSWKTQKEECLKVIKEADIIHIHHDWDFESIENIIKDKTVIVTLYNLSNSLQYERSKEQNIEYFKRLKKYCKLFTVSDQPLQKIMFSDITTITVPLVKNLFNEETQKDSEVPHIVFAPTNRDKVGI
ncbi:MAG: hypothetical protein AABY22_29645, partial [Nanoarchaeota archaeon]